MTEFKAGDPVTVGPFDATVETVDGGNHCIVANGRYTWLPAWVPITRRRREWQDGDVVTFDGSQPSNCIPVAVRRAGRWFVAGEMGDAIPYTDGYIDIRNPVRLVPEVAE